MLPANLTSPREVTLYYDSIYHDLISSGQIIPFVYPWQGLGAFLVLTYLLLDHRRSKILKWVRYPVFAFLCVFQIWCILRTRAKHPAGAFGVGLLSAWGVLWTAALLLMNDCQSDFQRLERVEKVSSIEISRRNGSSKTNTPGQTDTKDSDDPLIWQQYPATFLKRLDWVIDVFINFRGIGWNWQTSGIPPRPQPIPRESKPNANNNISPTEITTSRTGIRRTSNRDFLLRTTCIRLCIGYLALDVVKILMHRDAYFWGYTDASAPDYLPQMIQTSTVLLKIYRLAIALFGLGTALSQAFSLGPLFFCFILGPERIGLRGEAWMNPADMFGSYVCVWDYGLAGWWSGWWHQTFRFAFDTAAEKVLLRMGIQRKSTRGRTVGLFVAFFLSGCLHAAGSHTQIGDTRPLMGPMRFFLLQPLGILLQLWTVRQLEQVGVLDKTPRWLRRVANFTFVHVWGYYTAPLLIDDFAEGGNFLFEPIAFSPLRALGLGAKDDTWYCWWDGILFWRSGRHWWDTGLAV